MSDIAPSVSQPQDIQAQATAWLARRNQGEHGAEEQRAFLVWLNASTAHRDAYTCAEALWEQMRGLDTVANKQLAEARAFLAKKRRQTALRRYAMAALILLAAGSIVWQADWLSYLDDQTYQTAHGQTRAVDLADGSRLELNTDSAARVHYSRHGREIRLLRGQAVFTVAHGDQRPFDVLVGQGKIRDIGTQFDVRLAADGVAVAVLDGEVEVAGTPTARPVAVHRGQKIGFRPSGELVPIQSIDISNVSA